MSLKINKPNKPSFAVTNANQYTFPPDGNDSEIVTRVANQDVYSYEQSYFNGADSFANLSFTAMGPTFSVNQGWRGSVLAPNGTIYASPWSSPSVLAVNTYTDVVTEIVIPTDIPNLPSRTGWQGGVCMPNGKIYRFSESTASGILVQDTNTNTFSYINVNYGSLIGGYTGCVLGPNGKIYGVPGFADNVIVFNPTNDSYSFITSPDISVNGGRKWFGGVLAPNGNIYCFPRRNASSILVINTLNDTMTASIPTLGGLFITPTSEGPYWGGCLAHNGKIYGAPTNSNTTFDISLGSRFIEIDPSSNTWKFVGAQVGTGDRKLSGPTLGLDGWIYCAGDNGASNSRFNPDTYEIQTLGGNRRWASTLAPNGKIYFHPRPTPANGFISIKTGYPQLQPWMMAPEFNSF